MAGIKASEMTDMVRGVVIDEEEAEIQKPSLGISSHSVSRYSVAAVHE
jgi:hypothetical protein